MRLEYCSRRRGINGRLRGMWVTILCARRFRRSSGVRTFRRAPCAHVSVHPPSPRCPDCLSSDLAPEVVSGRATVVAHTVNVQEWIPGSGPYLIGLVAIDEDERVRLTTNLVDVALEDVRTGMAVEVVFDHHDDVYLPLFRPVTGDP